MQLGSNLISKWLNHAKKRFEDQNKIKKKSITIHYKL